MWLLVLPAHASEGPPLDHLRAGDVVFQHSRSRQSAAIEVATGSPLTHMGLVLPHGGHLMVIEAAVAKMTAFGEALVGKHYDAAFSWTDERMYCSELVYKVFDRALGLDLGQLRELRDFNLTAPVVGAALRDRYGTAVPLGEIVIAPSDIAADPRLVGVNGE